MTMFSSGQPVESRADIMTEKQKIEDMPNYTEKSQIPKSANDKMKYDSSIRVNCELCGTSISNAFNLRRHNQLVHGLSH